MKPSEILRATMVSQKMKDKGLSVDDAAKSCGVELTEAMRAYIATADDYQPISTDFTV